MNVRKTLWIGILALGLPVLAEAVPMNLEQATYRWRNDDGSEAAATWKAAANTPITGVKRGENMRVRFAFWNTATMAPTADTLCGRVEYAESQNGPWIAVGLNPGRAFQMATTSGYANGQPTTALLPLSGSTFTPGQCVEDPANDGKTIGLGNGKAKYSNLEYCFQATALAKRNTTYYFRMSQLAGDPTAPDTFTYTCYATLTIENTDPPPSADIYVDDDDVNTARIGDALAVPISLGAGAKEHLTEYVQTWKAACGSTVGAWQGGSRYNSAVAGVTNAIAFRWIPSVPVAAQYNVYARWTYNAERGRNVPYSIRHANGTAEVFVNQRDPALGAKWNLLGTYTFNIGTNGWVALGGNDGVACADAVWLQRVN